MPQEYQPALEVEDVARDLINAHHPHLATVRIDYVFASDPLKEKGKIVWGRAKKVSGLNAWLASETRQRDAVQPEEFFVVEINKAVWQQLDEKCKKALVDHELTHCDLDPETSKLSMRPHDLEEFNIIVRRYGLWRADVQLFLEAIKHPDLFSNDDDNRDYERATVAAESDRLTRGANG
jgi:hypothetical protein